ncbi:hypothetical protein F8154_13935 [Alkaliphilus pronyensis]|uniref:Uncharacterized protein n=1 Tax=Alkaliphilus pronyensis TaxID=1482732 RepID=A0A6I0EVS9_9FIRM|nr:sigma factor-like helix-turn-helix DNA-binding protein [Alkaliphilus pronyensis]KAB3530333.1 hypothetical protein F8154_13935 [Alkaliphilus pronyensis]
MNRLVSNYVNSQKESGKQVNKDNLDNVNNNDTAADKFNDYVFRVYLYSYIKKTIVFTAWQIKKKQKELYNYEELSLDVVDPGFSEKRVNYIMDTVKSNDIVEEEEGNYDYTEISHKKEITEAISTLTERQKEIIYRCIILNESDTNVAKRLGISKQGVNKTKITALNKLKKRLGKKYKRAI